MAFYFINDFFDSLNTILETIIHSAIDIATTSIKIYNTKSSVILKSLIHLQSYFQLLNKVL